MVDRLEKSFFLLKRKNGSPSLKKRKVKSSFVAVWLLLRDFSFGGVKSVDMIVSQCFFEQLPGVPGRR
jgi:hypothetical protein